MFWKTRRQLKREVKFWKNRALTDPLTKVNNRLALDETDPSPFSWLTFIDIKNLGRVNKEQGFYQGDSLILETIESIKLELHKQLLLNSSKIFRVGGDEFIILSKNPISLPKQNSLYLHSQIRLTNRPLDSAIQIASVNLKV